MNIQLKLGYLRLITRFSIKVCLDRRELIVWYSNQIFMIYQSDVLCYDHCKRIVEQLVSSTRIGLLFTLVTREYEAETYTDKNSLSMTSLSLSCLKKISFFWDRKLFIWDTYVIALNQEKFPKTDKLLRWFRKIFLI